MKRAWIAVLAVLLLAVAVCGADIYDTQKAALPLTELDRSISGEPRELLGNRSPSDSGSFVSGMTDVLADSLSDMTGYLREGVSTCAEVLLLTVLCAAFSSVDNRKLSAAVLLAGACGVCLCLFGSVRTMVRLGQETVAEYEAFSEALLPVVSAASAASGAATASAAIYAVSVFFFHLLMRLIQSLLLPILTAIPALSACDAALGQTRLSGIKETLCGFVKGSLKGILIVFTGFLTVTGVTSGSVDAAALKAAKFGISTAVPIVGGIAADASDSVLAGVRLLRDSIGTFGMLAAVAIGITPFLRIGAQYLLLKGTSALCAVTGAKELSALVRDGAAVMGFLAAITGVCALFVFLSVICFLKGFVL